MLALNLAPAEYLLVSPIVGIVTIVVLLAWTARYVPALIRALSAQTTNAARQIS